MPVPPDRGRVLVTGLTGFTGAYVARALAARGYVVVDPSAIVPQFDLTDPATIGPAVAEADHVVHLAAISFIAHADAADFYRVNTVGTTNLLDALALRPASVRRLVVASSANVYGTSPHLPITEAAVPRPVNHYAASKLAMEALAGTYADRLPLTLVRPFNYTGIGQDERFLVSKIVAHFVRRAPEIALGNLDVARDFSDVRDVAEAYVDLLEAPAAGETVNICSGKARSLRWIIDCCAGLTGHTPAIKTDPALLRRAEVTTLVGSAARLRALTGRAPGGDFRSTLAWMLDPAAAG